MERYGVLMSSRPVDGSNPRLLNQVREIIRVATTAFEPSTPTCNGFGHPMPDIQQRHLILDIQRFHANHRRMPNPTWTLCIRILGCPNP